MTIDENIYELKKLERNKKISEEIDELQVIKKEKKKYIPPMSHPWKAESFKRQIKRAHTEHVYA